MPNAATRQPDPWKGRSIGDGDRYRLEKRLGRGGMGDVFLATDTRLGKPVALKLLKESLIQVSSVNLAQRFERECAICAALKSEHIVQVSDYGVTPEGCPFYVMELLQGQTLEERLILHPRLSIEEACQIIIQVCAGLEAAHQGVVIRSDETAAQQWIKVVHRDLKPANIFLVPTTLGELVKIIDFGIAKIRSLQAETSEVTQVFLGTCHYAAPEQFTLAAEIDERVDIYSLGMMLYEMLSGVDPFGLDFRNRRVPNESWLTAHTSLPPQPLRQQPDCEQLPPALEAIVLRCLAKAPADRFSSVTALRQALQSIAAASPLMPLLASEARRERAGQPSSPAGQDTVLLAPHQSTPASETAAPHSQRPRSRPHLLPWLLAGTGLLLALAIGTVYRLRGPEAPLGPAQTARSAALSLIETLPNPSGPVWAVVLSFDGRTLISSGEDPTIKVWNVDRAQVVRSLTGHRRTVRSLSLSADGQTLASGSSDGTIKLWNMQSGALLRTLTDHNAAIWSVALSRDGQTLVSGSEDSTLQIWNVATGKLLHRLTGHSAPVYAVALSRDGQTVASGSADGTILLWNLRTGQPLHTLKGHQDAVRSVAFSLDGQTLASASWDKTVKLWQPQTGALQQTLEGHRDRVVAVTFSFDSQTLASASLDRTIRLWDAHSGQALETLSGHSDWVLTIANSPSSRRLVSGSKDQTIKIWQ